MKITNVIIEDFRSIEQARLDDCGDINVLIGKNNAGKSNILLALDKCIQFIKKGEIFQKDHFIDNVDFSGNPFGLIDIKIQFTLESSLMKRIINLFKNSDDLNNIEEYKYYTINIRHNFGITYCNEISIQDNSQKNLTLLKISNKNNNDNGYQMYTQYQEINQINETINSLRDLIKSQSLRSFIRNPPPRGNITINSMEKINDRKIKSRLSHSISQATSFSEIEAILENEISRNSKISDDLIGKFLNKILITKSNYIVNQINPINSINGLLKLFSGIKNTFLLESRADISPSEITYLLKTKNKRNGARFFNDLQKTIKQFTDVEMNVFEEDENENPELDIDGFLLQVNGYGIREVLSIILNYERYKPNILFIEEPELHLHPSLEINLMRYFKQISTECQIFMTTHSTNFIDTGDVKNVYLVSKNESTTVQALNTEEAASLIPQELGLRLSSLFMYDKLIFVEGKLDEAILRVWATTLGINLSQHNIGFVHMGGIKNYNYFANEEILNLLGKKQVKLWFLTDRDERNNKKIAQLQSRIQGKADLWLLNKREIENYLFAPRAIALFLQEKGRESGKPLKREAITPELIEQSLNDSAEQWKQQVIDKHIAARFPEIFINNKVVFPDTPTPDSFITRSINEFDRLLATIQSAKEQLEHNSQEAAAAVEELWSRDPLAIVQGDKLLDTVFFDYYGIHFKKERDGVPLAACMNASEINQEIKDFFNAIIQ